MTSSTAQNEPSDHPEPAEYPLSEGAHRPQSHPNQPSALNRIAAIAPTLKEAELRVLQLLTAWAETAPHHTVTASSRTIAAFARVARSKVQPALDSLTARDLITTRQGTATSAASYHLNVLETVFLTGPLPGPPPPRSGATAPLFAEEELAPKRGHTGPLSGPPETANQPLPPPTPALDSDYDRSNPLIDRVLRAKPSHFPQDLIEEATTWMLTHMRKCSNRPSVHPPEPTVVAQVLACGPWEAIAAVLTDLLQHYTTPGERYAWYVTVMLQRLHDIRPEQVRRRREQLRAIKGGKASAPPESPDPDFGPQLARTIASRVRSL